MLPLILAAAIALPWDVPVGSVTGTVVRTERPFEAAGVSWSASAEAVVRARVRRADGGWSEWRTLAIDGDLTDRSSGRYFTAITHFGAESEELEYSFDGDVTAVTVTFFPSPPAVPPAEARPRTLGVEEGIRTRVAWGCPDGETSPLWTPTYSAITHAVVHHTAGANNLIDWASEVRNIWYYHTYTNGWGDIGYNYLIDPNGVVYEGRAGGEGVIGAHFSCRNTNTVGVALLGTYSSVLPTEAALSSLEALLAAICRKNGIDPMAIVHHASSGLDLPTILGHRDGNVPGATCTITECPGDVLYSLLPALRSDLEGPPRPRRRAVRP